MAERKGEDARESSEHKRSRQWGRENHGVQASQRCSGIQHKEGKGEAGSQVVAKARRTLWPLDTKPPPKSVNREWHGQISVFERLTLAPAGGQIREGQTWRQKDLLGARWGIQKERSITPFSYSNIPTSSGQPTNQTVGWVSSRRCADGGGGGETLLRNPV